MTQFEKDLKQDLYVNGKESSRGMWNLIVSRRDLGLWKTGMKPNRHWKVTDVKKYFGLKGNKEKLYDDICKMVEEYTKLPVMTRHDFIEKYFIPTLTKDEQRDVALGFIGWEDSFLDSWAKKIGVTIDHNFDREQCNGCKEHFEDGVMSYNDDNDKIECETCYGTEY
tara:strand:+ start:307 stop:807 length:501 start_codon:yes stop_codon:yes gene_type:complete